MEYRLFTNIRDTQIEHVEMCLSYLGIKYKIEPNAIDIHGFMLPNHSSVYIDAETPLKLRNSFFFLSSKIAEEYGRAIVESGFATETETKNKFLYYGCEKEYWSDRDRTKLEEYYERMED